MSFCEIGGIEQSFQERYPLPVTATESDRQHRITTIARIVDATKTKTFDSGTATFLGIYIKNIEKTDPRILEDLRGSDLIDLGAGCSYDMLKLSAEHAVRRYTAVDIFTSPFILERRADELARMKQFNDIPTELIQYREDMLRFLSHQDDNSAHIMLNGIDTLLIDSPDYGRWLVAEIARVTGKNHLALGVQGNDYLDPLTQYSFANQSSYPTLKIYKYAAS